MNWGCDGVPTREHYQIARAYWALAGTDHGISEEQYRYCVSIFRRCGLWDEGRNSTKLCDFCDIEPLVYRLPCPDYVALIVCGELSTEQAFSGGWSACDECARLVQEDRREELSRRSAETYYEVSPEDHSPQEENLLLIRAVHEAFFQYWTGEVERVG
jgi:hypothetical protein